ncbi:hypothetical protein [Brevibacterium moorei]|uniref:hypothetical protein n=1 Tax=Brevibacterium moorei TaxID=2968457 RepID=UPI00211CF85B|nr:hypothetical protein [Brevibacterium sp. 68QC2CO]MCQ9384387.1 hypothetical protein [Brevibacterium sp. 68QC2CO]
MRASDPGPADDAGELFNLQPAKRKSTPKGGYPEEFEAWWKVYPKKADKRAALKAWRAARERTNPSTLMAAAAAYRDDPNRRPQFTKNPATWLNADAWENEALPDRTPESTAHAQRQARMSENLAVLQRAMDRDAAQGAQVSDTVGRLLGR